MNPAISSATAGLSAIGERVQDRAERIARDSAVTKPETEEREEEELDPVTFSSSDPVEDIVGLGTDEVAFKANAAVIKTTQDMEKQLLDIIA